MATRSEFEDYLNIGSKKIVKMTRLEIEHFRITLCRQWSVPRRDIKLMSLEQYNNLLRKKFSNAPRKINQKNANNTKQKIYFVLFDKTKEPIEIRLIFTLFPYKTQELKDEVDSDYDSDDDF